MKICRVALPVLVVLLSTLTPSPANASPPGANLGGQSARPEVGRPLSDARLLERILLLDPGFPPHAAEGAIGCRIEDAFGNSVNTVNALSQTGDGAFWLVYLNDGGVDQSVRLLVFPAFEGSPLTGQVQIFETNDACNISTPFGIPFWGGDLTSGLWRLVVRNDRGGVAICSFEVVP